MLLGRVGFFGGFFRDPFTVQKHFSGRIQNTYFNHPNATPFRNTTNGIAYMVISSYVPRPRPDDLN